eukprot:CAMPEP_0115849386 /NCGR_PEP_ID=MMETSP0287-20121206/11424_1 /TAXON_ID=412157 /ORGANISM="Chrysochromulina rotalis, Strain UIO044" /LENGTH=470 /DNA_ID=CAMNT_0003303355 /DNA_START=214 /DNA_END=1626 /DNA_ORIENTATION=+
MTFHRHRVPEMLLQKGLRFSVNLDPDVLCLRPWDLNILLNVELIAGRPVGAGARTARWLQERASTMGMHSANGQVRIANVTEVLHTALNMSLRSLRHSQEYNGGILVFNNSGAARVQWASTLARYHMQAKSIVEGDQDLLGLMLAAEPSFPRRVLPSTYNYAYRRDRERLPYAVAHRLRHGLISNQVINVHFVMDGKPWRKQNLTVYPMWLLAARLHHLGDWYSISQKMRPRLSNLHLDPTERNLIGPTAFRVLRSGLKGRNDSLAELTDENTRRRCRCFVRSLSRDKKADPIPLLRKASPLEQPQQSASVHMGRPGRAEHKASSPGIRPTSPAGMRALVAAQRGTLLWVCGGTNGDDGPPPEEVHACDVELGANREKFLCALSASQLGVARHSKVANNCSAQQTGMLVSSQMPSREKAAFTPTHGHRHKRAMASKLKGDTQPSRSEITSWHARGGKRRTVATASKKASS